MAKISQLEYSPKPIANQFHFTVFTQNIDLVFEIVILQIGDVFYYPKAVGNQFEVNITSMVLPMNKGQKATKLKVKAFLYNFKKDTNTYVAEGEISLFNVDVQTEMANVSLALDKTTDVTQPWVKGLRVTKVTGPFQDGHEVDKIDLEKPVSYIAFVEDKKLNKAQFLSIKWSYAIDGGPKKRFNHPMEWANDWVDDHVFMQCNMLKEWAGKQVSVYAFFNSESEQVVSRHVAQSDTPAGPVFGDNDPDIVFPLLVKPENNTGNKWGASYNWSALQRQNMATFNSNRSGGRRHAARDLYTNPKETVVAICDGEVLRVDAFYARTDQVTILHKTKSGKQFIVRYGELAPDSITVKKGDKVFQKQKLGETGKLIKANSQPLLKIGGTIVYMLHFELFSGAAGMNLTNRLTTSSGLFRRRSDLKDPLELLEEGFRNTFQTDDVAIGRKDIASLTTSTKGLDFIKSWEAYRKDAYNDSEGFCTIGYGHLIAKKKCENLTLPPEFKNGVSKEKATEMLKTKIKEFEISLKKDITVSLHQYEFDALMSLIYNTGPNFLRTGGRGNGPTQIMKQINTGNYTDGAHEFSDVTNGGVTGLVNRRKAEIDMFLNNNYVNH